jgi:predicted MFS family arabinose efflux permease
LISRLRSSLGHGLGRDVWFLCAGSGIATGANLGMVQLLRVLYVLRLGQGPEFVGTMIAISSMSFSLTGIPGGVLGSRFGQRSVILAGCVIMVMGTFLLPLTQAVPEAWRYAWPILSQLVTSCGWSMVVVNQAPALMAYTDVSTRRSAFALREVLGGAGMMSGVLVGGLLPGLFANAQGITTAAAAPYRDALWVAAAVNALALVPYAIMRPARAEVNVEKGVRTGRVPYALLALGFFCGFLNNGAMSTGKSFASAYMDQYFGLSTSFIGTITAVGMGLGIAGAFVGMRLSRKGPSQSMWISAVALAVALALMASVPLPWAAAVGTVLVMSLQSVFIPAYQMNQMELVEPQWRSLISGIAAMTMSAGFGLASFVGGFIVASSGYPRVFLLGVFLALASAAASLTLRSGIGQRDQVEAS